MNLTKLKELAQGATPGPWKIKDRPGGHRDLVAERAIGENEAWRPQDIVTAQVGFDGFGSGGVDPWNGPYLAAVDPTTVLDMIDYIKELEKLAIQLWGHDEDPCQYDHDGWCQIHYRGEDYDCPHSRIAKVFEKYGRRDELT